MTCPSCKFDNPSAARFCEQCGTALEVKCPRCSATVSAGARFCGACGNQLATPEAPSAEPSYSKPRETNGPRLRRCGRQGRHYYHYIQKHKPHFWAEYPAHTFALTGTFQECQCRQLWLSQVYFCVTRMVRRFNAPLRVGDITPVPAEACFGIGGGFE
jgi:Double zinc ribbon